MHSAFRSDLHVHTCLSPCGECEMVPQGIAREAKKKGLDVIGICDHNSTRNTAAVRRACDREGIALIAGVEVCSQEEVHMLGLFDQEESLHEMQRLIDENLDAENDSAFFGDQLVCDEHDAVIDTESRLLIGATKLGIEQIVENIHRLGGLAIASHVDRDRFSLFSQLGFVPETLQVDALEISPHHSMADVVSEFPEMSNYPLVHFSDAHRLNEIGRVFTTFTGTSPCVVELRKALLGEDGREVVI